MKSIGICYNEQAVKVSNSHSSTPPSDISPSRSSFCSYKVKLSTEKRFFIELAWPESPSKQGFSVNISQCCPVLPSNESRTHIVLRQARGMGLLEIGDSKIEVHWDLNRAEYESGPEPVSGFYVVVLVDNEPGLVLGDVEEKPKEVEKWMHEARSSSDFRLISRCEYVIGNFLPSFRARFCDKGKCHDISIKFSGANISRNSIFWVYVDKKSVVQVKRLGWNFRGNQTIYLDGLLVDLMWDFHGWLFGPVRSSRAVFLFRTRVGLDSRLWLEGRNDVRDEEVDDLGFSMVICACKNNPDWIN